MRPSRPSCCGLICCPGPGSRPSHPRSAGAAASRATLVRLSTSGKNRIHAVLADRGIAQDRILWTGPGRAWLAGLELPPIPGRPLHPDLITDWFQRHAKRVVWEQAGRTKVGLPAIRLHDVRHSYATAALAAGIPAKIVSERLATPTSRSPSTPTATSSRAWTSRRLRDCFHGPARQ